MILTVYVKPGAREDSFEKVDETTVKISVKAKAIKGLANEAVISLLSDHYKVPKLSIEIKHGHKSKIKHISIETKNTY